MNSLHPSTSPESKPSNSWNDPSLVVLATKLVFFATCLVLLTVPLVTVDVTPIIAGAPFLALYGYGWYSAKKGDWLQGAWVFIVGTWFLQMFVVLLIPNLDAQALVSSVNLVLAAGFMLGRSQAMGTSIVCGSSIVAVYALREFGYAPTPILPATPSVVEMATVVVTLTATGGLTFIGIRHMTRAIVEAEKSRAETRLALEALEKASSKEARRAWRQERLGIMARSLVELRESTAITHEVTVGLREALSVDVALAIGRGGQVISAVGLGEKDLPIDVLSGSWSDGVVLGECSPLDAKLVQRLSGWLQIEGSLSSLCVGVPHSSMVLIVLCIDKELHSSDAAWSLQVAANLHGAAIHRLLREQRGVQTDKMEAIGRLSAGIAHDFNNLLTSVLGGAEIIDHKLGAGHSLEPQVQGIREAGERAAALTSKLMSFTRGTPRQPLPVNPVDVVQDLIPMLRRSVEENIIIETHLEEEGLWVSADPIDLERIVLNLILNARDALGRSGKVDIGVDARSGLDDSLGTSDSVVIWVQDDGEGMDLAIRTRVFEPFFTTRKDKGSTGLGLSIVYGVVESMGGDIYVDSVPGQGTCFEVVLPRLWDPEIPEPSVPVKLDVHGGARIMVVEDDPDVRLTLSEMLKLGGFDVLQVGSAQEAIDTLTNTEDIDLVLSDVVMPGMGGFDLAKLMKTRKITVPMAFISGYAAGQGMRAEEDVTHPFISKPFSLVELLDFVQAQLV